MSSGATAHCPARAQFAPTRLVFTWRGRGQARTHVRRPRRLRALSRYGENDEGYYPGRGGGEPSEGPSSRSYEAAGRRTGWTASDDAEAKRRGPVWDDPYLDDPTERRIARVSLLTMTAALVSVATLTERSPSIALVGLVLFVTPVTRRYIQGYIAGFVRGRHERWRAGQDYDGWVYPKDEQGGHQSRWWYADEWSPFESLDPEEGKSTDQRLYLPANATSTATSPPPSPPVAPPPKPSPRFNSNKQLPLNADDVRPYGSEKIERNRRVRASPPKGRDGSRGPPPPRQQRARRGYNRNKSSPQPLDDDSGILGLKWESSETRYSPRSRPSGRHRPRGTGYGRDNSVPYSEGSRRSGSIAPRASPRRRHDSVKRSQSSMTANGKDAEGQISSGNSIAGVNRQHDVRAVRDDWLGKPRDESDVSRGWVSVTRPRTSYGSSRRGPQWRNDGETYGESGMLERYDPAGEEYSSHEGHRAARGAELWKRALGTLIPGLRSWGGWL
mmetsp:Transcript_9428/g.34603  ORF Transcript_9428/g.34603 Transcript_9428/m.34603 type:complete len:500 (+) Transcript_9428:103-1602(+)